LKGGRNSILGEVGTLVWGGQGKGSPVLVQRLLSERKVRSRKRKQKTKKLPLPLNWGNSPKSGIPRGGGKKKR